MQNLKQRLGDFLYRRSENDKQFNSTIANTRQKRQQFFRVFGTILLVGTIIPSLLLIVHAETEPDPALDQTALSDEAEQEADELESEDGLDEPEVEESTSSDLEVAPAAQSAPIAQGQPTPIAGDCFSNNNCWRVRIVGVDPGEDKTFDIANGQTIDNDSVNGNAAKALFYSLMNKTDKRFVGYEYGGKVYNESNSGENGWLKLIWDDTHSGGETVTYTAKYKVDIVIDEISTTLDYGSGATQDMKDKVKNHYVPYDKSSFAYYYDSDDALKCASGDPNDCPKVDLETVQFKKHTTLDPKFNVRISFVGINNNQSVEVTSPVQLNKVPTLYNAAKSDPYKTFTGNFLVDGQTKPEDYVVTYNTNVTPLYNIKVTINNQTAVLPEGSKLTDHPYYNTYKNRKGFKEFRNNGKVKVEETLELHQHTSVTAVYAIQVSIPGFAAAADQKTFYELESGDTMEEKMPAEVIQKLKSNDARGRTLSRLTDGLKNTVYTNVPLYEDVSIVPLYNNQVTIYRKNDDGQPADSKLNFTIEEGSHLLPTNSSSINQWVQQQIQALSDEGKTNPKFLRYRDSASHSIDLTNYYPQNNDQIEAVFTSDEDPEPIPDVPSTTTPTNPAPEEPAPEPQTSESVDSAAPLKVPNTGFKVVADNAAPILSIGLVFVFAVRYLRLRSKKTKTFTSHSSSKDL